MKKSSLMLSLITLNGDAVLPAKATIPGLFECTGTNDNREDDVKVLIVFNHVPTQNLKKGAGSPKQNSGNDRGGWNWVAVTATSPVDEETVTAGETETSMVDNPAYVNGVSGQNDSEYYVPEKLPANYPTAEDALIAYNALTA